MVFIALHVIIMISQYRIDNMRAWAEQNIRLILRRVGVITIQSIQVVIYPFTFNGQTGGKVGSYLTIACALLCVNNITLYIIDKVRK